MKCKRLLIMIMSLMFAMSTCTIGYAQSEENDEIYAFNDVIYDSSAPKTLANSSARAIWVTYPKMITKVYVMQTSNPYIGDFPQSIFYSEPNPSGYGEDAKGTLYLESFGRVYPDDPNSKEFYCHYSGTMGYFLL